MAILLISGDIMNNEIFCDAEWIAPPKYLKIEPIDVYHKEQEKKEIELLEKMKNLHIFFKKKVFIEKRSNKYTIRITADDYYKLYINGNFVGQGPAQGYYFNYYWNEYDITKYMKDGINEIFVEAYYQGLISRAYNSGDRRIGMIAALFENDTAFEITDRSWQYAISKSYKIRHIIGYDTAFAEDYDGRETILQWKKCASGKPNYSFSKDCVKSLQVYAKKPTKEILLENSGILYDFGEEITGTIKIIAEGEKGARIRILCGEELEDSDVKVRYDMRCNCLYEEYWTLDDGINEYNQYDYKAFRYVALILPPKTKILNVEAIVRHYPFDDNYCVLETNNKILKSVWDICKNGVKYSSQEVFVDCPTREKGQYAGDLTVTGASHVVLTGDTSLLKKAIDNQMQSTRICKGVMAVTPGSLMQEIADYSLQFPILSLRYFKYTGDKNYLKENLKICEGIIEHFKQFAREDGLIQGVYDKWNLVDWPENFRDNYDFPLTNPMEKTSGAHNVVNAFYVGCVMLTEEIRDILGIEHKSESETLIKSFNEEFYNNELGLYVDKKGSEHASIHSNTIPLFYGISKEKNEEKICDFIMQRGLCCGVYMAYFVLKALCRAKRYEDAYSLIISQDENSWYNMVREGATTCFEAWSKEKKWNTSLCHPWASSPISVLAEDILPNMPHVGKIIYNKQ